MTAEAPAVSESARSSHPAESEQAGSRGRSSEIPLIVKQSGTVPVVQHVPAFVWRCQECGWLGTGLTSERAARVEGSDHLWNDHRIVSCRPGEHGDDHRWVEVLHTDIEVCTRCEWEIGK